jgi:hypothetical protein
MSIFEDVLITWSGTEYKIESSRVMGAIARVEEVITLKELFEFHQKNSAPLAKLSMAFAAVLNYAGANVTEEKVYEAMFTGDNQMSVINSINTLLMMMIPPSSLKAGNAEAAPTGGKN